MEFPVSYVHHASRRVDGNGVAVMGRGIKSVVANQEEWDRLVHQIPLVDVRYRFGDYRLDSRILQCPGSVLAGTARSPAFAGHNDILAACDAFAEVGTHVAEGGSRNRFRLG